MKTDGKYIEIESIPNSIIKIDEISLRDLKDLFNDFNFTEDNGFYNFVYETLYIVISYKGSVFISLVSATSQFQNIRLIRKLIDKINDIISVPDFSTKIRIHI